MSNYIFSQINDESYPAIQELYLRSFGIKESVETIKEKYNTSAFGLKNIGFLAKDSENDLAAYYGVFPMRMSIDGKDYLIAQSGDTMTAPEHQKKGLFTDLAKLTYKLAQEKGIQMVFGFPNKNSLPGFQKKLDWQFYGCMQNFTIFNNVIPLCEISFKYKHFLSFYKKYCQSKLAKYKIHSSDFNIEIFNDKSSKGNIKRDIDFFNYKLRDKNSYLIKINDFTLLIKPLPHLNIGAVGTFQPESTDDFIRTLKLLAKKLGCKRTIISVSENHWLFKYLKDKVEHTESFPIGYFSINPDLPYSDISFIGADYDTF
jgi:predicted N-acetyltransferase YhbS